METKIFNFKHELRPNNNLINKQDLFKNKDFNKTLETVKYNNNSYKDNDKNSKNSKNCKKVNSETLSNTNNIKNTDKLKSEDENNITNKNDHKNEHEEIILLFTNTLEIRPDNLINQEDSMDLDLEKENVILNTNIIKNPDIPEALNLEEKIENNDIVQINEDKEYNTKESETDKESKFVFDDNKDDKIKIGSKVDVKMLLNKVDKGIEEELSNNNLKNSINTVQIVKDSDLSNLDRKHNSQKSTPNQEESLEKTISYKDDLDIKDKPFSFLDKKEVIVENTIETSKPDTIDRKDLIQQIVDKMKINLSESKNEIRVKLKPEVFGEMTMNIEVVKGEVIAKIMVDTQRTKEIIEANLVQLKEGIKDTALEIKTFEVFVGSGSDFDKHNSSQFNLKQNNKKIKIKPENNKIVKNYQENLTEDNINSIGLYSENGLNLFA